MATSAELHTGFANGDREVSTADEGSDSTSVVRAVHSKRYQKAFAAGKLLPDKNYNSDRERGMRFGKVVAVVSTTAALVAAFVAWTDDLDPQVDPAWLVEWVGHHKSLIAQSLFVLVALLSISDWIRAHIEKRHQEKWVLDKMINDLSRTLFSNGARNNRITLFIHTVGWRYLLWSIIKLPKFSHLHKWAALTRINLRADYIGVYLRPAGARSMHSPTAFRVSDTSSECEGVAGRIWDAASQVIIAKLPGLNIADVRALKSNADIAGHDIIRKYAEKTSISDYRLLKSCGNFARHFLGTDIRKSDGSPWGVLLLDSLEEDCPFFINDEPDKVFIQRFNDCARVIGRIVS